jgi:peptidoglycan biosynthesis protein MviN/MurJ (putative lipid II flippase)
MKIVNYKAGLILSLFFNAISKGLVFLVSISVAFYFGANASTDVYFFMVGLILMTNNFLLGLTGSVVIPEFMRQGIEESPGNSQAFANKVLYIIMGVIAAITIGIFIWPVSFFSTVSNFESTLINQQLGMIRLALVALILQASVTFLNEVLVARKYFILPALIAIVNSTFAILFVVFFYDTFGLASVFFANIIALLLSLIAQLVILIRFEKWNFHPRYAASVRLVKTDFLYAVLGIIASTVSAFFPIYLLSNFIGMLTEYNYSQRIADIPNSLLTLQFASIAGVRFNELYSKGNKDEINTNFLISGRALMFILIPFSLLTYAFSKQITSILFFKSALSESALENISSFIGWLILATPFVGLIYLTIRMMMAARKLKESTTLQVSMVALHGVLAFTGVHLFGAKGFVYSYILYQIIFALSLYLYLNRQLPFIRYALLLKYIAIMFLYSAPLLFAVVFFIRPLQQHLAAPIVVAMAASMYGLIILATNHWMKINEEIALFQRHLSLRFFSALRKR